MGEDHHHHHHNHHHHHHHHQPITRLWKLISTCLSEHGRRSLVHKLSFSPLTPTGNFTLHLSDPKEYRIAVNLITMAHTMSMEWARRCIQLREKALAETLVVVSEEKRQQHTERERRSTRDKRGRSIGGRGRRRKRRGNEPWSRAATPPFHLPRIHLILPPTQPPPTPPIPDPTNTIRYTNSAP